MDYTCSPPPPQCLHPRGQRPLSTGAAGGLTPPHPSGPGPGLAPAQPLLDRLRGQVHLRRLGGRHQEAGARRHRSERAPEHRAGPPPRVSKDGTGERLGKPGAGAFSDVERSRRLQRDRCLPKLKAGLSLHLQFQVQQWGCRGENPASLSRQ